MMNVICSLLLVISSTVVNAQTPSPAETPLNSPAAKQPEAYDLSPQLDYVYDPTGKKDPFKPYKAPRIRGDNRPVVQVDPLTTLEVGQLKVIAIMWNTPKPRAVIRDNQNRSFIIFKNMKIGRNEGVVVDIREGEVVIVEKFDDGFGNTVREAKVLELNSPADRDNQSAQQSAGG